MDQTGDLSASSAKQDYCILQKLGRQWSKASTQIIVAIEHLWLREMLSPLVLTLVKLCADFPCPSCWDDFDTSRMCDRAVGSAPSQMRCAAAYGSLAELLLTL